LQPHLGWLPAPLWRHGALARLGSEAEPLSASALERYAACPFRFFAADVLRVRTTPLRQEESEAGEAGAIAHRAFEVVIRALLAAGHSALGPGSREACRTVATAALAAWWPQEGRLERLHPVLREQTEAQVQAQVLALLADLCAEASDFRLHGVELGFGQPGDAWPALRVDLPASPPPPAAASGALPTAVAAAPDASLWLRGRIDLLERAGTWARVSDLKSARLSSLQPRLRPSSFAVEALQLPIYAAAVQAAEPGLSGCDVRYLSLRDGRAGAGVWSLTEGRGAFRGQAAALAERLRVQPTASPPTALGARLASLTTQLRQGQFPAKPRAGACRLCDMQAICRISAQAQAMAGGDEGEAHGAP
ncbi:MAG: PD-(D/E)XK nuclease family protein, partial [Polyangiales bacterium]